MTLSTKTKHVLAKTIRNIRLGRNGLKSYIGLVDIFYRHIRNEYGWTPQNLNTTTLSFSNATTISNHLQTKRRFLQSHIETCVFQNEELKATTHHSVLYDIALLSAYTLLYQHVFIRIHHANEYSGADIDISSSIFQKYYENFSLIYPDIFHWKGVLSFVSIPTKSHHFLKEQLGKKEIQSCWQDPLTFGWIYQFWNDPQREHLDKKVKDQKYSIQRHEIASKTQLFTDSYIIHFTLANTINRMWMIICQKNGWVPECQSSGLLQELKVKKNDWMQRRIRKEINDADVLPLSEEEERWIYYVNQPIIQQDMVLDLQSIQDMKILDPACGAGHFLILAIEYLFPLYKEEARHRNEHWIDRDIVDSILSQNLHGIDIDPKVIQIASIALLVKAKSISNTIQPKKLNLVAPVFHLTDLEKKDVLNDVVEELQVKTGLHKNVVQDIILSLSRADYLGILLPFQYNKLKDVDSKTHDKKIPNPNNSADIEKERKQFMMQILGDFFTNYGTHDDIGLPLQNQPSAGFRYASINQEAFFHLVIMNPPYHSAGKMETDVATFQNFYPSGQRDLFTAFILRSMNLLKEGGISASVTLSNWMFLGSFEKFRMEMLNKYHLHLLCDIGKGAFGTGSKLIQTSISFFQNQLPLARENIAIRTYPPNFVNADQTQVQRHTASLRAWSECFRFDVRKLKQIESFPLIYWWNETFLQKYVQTTKFGEKTLVKQGHTTGNNERYLRFPFEVPHHSIFVSLYKKSNFVHFDWVPYIKGGKGAKWFEPCHFVMLWKHNGLENRNDLKSVERNLHLYFTVGVAFTTTGNNFSGRKHRFSSIFDAKGRSIFSTENNLIACSLNRTLSKMIMSALNPTIDFTGGDVEKLPLPILDSVDEIYEKLDRAFGQHESHRETSIEFKKPGPTCWLYTQNWAQKSVDRPPQTPLPEYRPKYTKEPPINHLSYALGNALGRFKPDGSGVIDARKDSLNFALPNGYLFLNGTCKHFKGNNSLGHKSCSSLQMVWKNHGCTIKPQTDLCTYLRKSFFSFHLNMYKKRPIYWPISSKNRIFVVWINIHRMEYSTFGYIKNELQKALCDLEHISSQFDIKSTSTKDIEIHQSHVDELHIFIKTVDQCVERGPDNQVDQPATYNPILEDGVMINASALYPLLEPQWSNKSNSPKIWWNSLCNAEEKNYDWSHLARRYFPDRVEERCKRDPALAIRHGCLWKYHPQCAWRWELRLQDEIGRDFLIKEVGHETYRMSFFAKPLSKKQQVFYQQFAPPKKKRKRSTRKDAIQIIKEEVIRRSKKNQKENQTINKDKPVQKPLPSSLHLNRSGLFIHHRTEMESLQKMLSDSKFTQRNFQIYAPDRDLS